jgi:hypothetical protein
MLNTRKEQQIMLHVWLATKAVGFQDKYLEEDSENFFQGIMPT